MQKSFKTIDGQEFAYPLFFPDATQGFVKSLDNQDVAGTGSQGVLVNTYHMWRHVAEDRMIRMGGVRNLMGWKGAIISDSGGFQVMSLAKRGTGMGKVVEEGVWFKPPDGPRMLLTPEQSVRYQLLMRTDLVVVLDDFTTQHATYTEAEETVRRTTVWARQSKDTFIRECEKMGIPEDKRPYIIGVVQGGFYEDLRKRSIAELVEIGFDGLGWGGWPINEKGELDYSTAKLITAEAPKEYLFYGLGVGKPENIVECYRNGWQIFDCVLPTRDARHGRLYIFNAKDMDSIDLSQKDFYSYYVPTQGKYVESWDEPVSSACDCHTCRNYSRAYLAHLFKVRDTVAGRLATIHNLRFYAILTEKLRSSSLVR